MLEFILFAFLVTPGGYTHLGWFPESRAAECRAVAKRENAKLPHKQGVIHREYALCRCFHCGMDFP